MISIKGKLTDAAGNPLPYATIEFYSKRNVGESLSGASAVCRTDQEGDYAFSLKRGEFEVFAQVSGSTDVSYIGDCVVGGETLAEETLESLMEMSTPILPESVLEVRQLTSQVRTDKDRVESLSSSVDEKHQSAVSLEAQSLAHAQEAKESKNSAAQSSQTAQQAASETQGVFEAAAKVDSDAISASDSASLATQKAQQAEASAQSARSDATQAKSANESAQLAAQQASDNSQSAAQSSSEARQAKDVAVNASVSAGESQSQVESLAVEAKTARDEAVNATQSKVDKVAGKGLSSNDFTDAEKSKLGGIAPAATRNLPDVDLSNLALAEMSGGKVVVHEDAHGDLQLAYRQTVITYDDFGISGCPFTGPVDVFRAPDGSTKPYHDIGIHLSSPKGSSVVSQSSRSPINRIDFDELRAKSESVAANAMLCGVYEYALLKWVMIALGHQPGGNTEYGRYHADKKQVGRRADGRVPNDRSGEARTLTGTGPNEWRHDGTPFGVADLTGNQWEWREGFKMSDGEFVIAEYCGQPESEWIRTGRFIAPGHVFAMANRGDARSSEIWSEFTKEDGYEGHELLQRLCIEPIEITRVLKGRFYYDTSGERSPLVGGSWYYGSNAGPAALSLYSPRSFRRSFIGGRLAFRV